MFRYRKQNYTELPDSQTVRLKIKGRFRKKREPQNEITEAGMEKNFPVVGEMGNPVWKKSTGFTYMHGFIERVRYCYPVYF